MDNLKKEAVNSPSHYNAGGIECIDAIRAALTPEEFRGFCKGNVLKYTWRERSKNGNEDMRKAARYNEYLLAAPSATPATNCDARDLAIAEAVRQACEMAAANLPSKHAVYQYIQSMDLPAIFARAKP